MLPQHLSPEYASFPCHHSSDPTLSHLYHQHHPGFLGGTSGKQRPCQCRRSKRLRFSPWVGQIPSRRAWQPTPVFSPGESHGQRSLAGYSLWGRKEWATTESLTHTLYSRAIPQSSPGHTMSIRTVTWRSVYFMLRMITYQTALIETSLRARDKSQGGGK